MTDQYAVLLQGIVADPAQPISRLPLLTAAERHRLLVEWSPTGRAGAPDTDIAELIEQQAARHPDAMAVKFGRQRLSYAELNGRANRLAHRLRALGVGPEVPVAGRAGVLARGGRGDARDPEGRRCLRSAQSR